MTESNVRLVADMNQIAGRLDAARRAANDLNRALVINDATWEPHDWSDWGQ